MNQSQGMPDFQLLAMAWGERDTYGAGVSADTAVTTAVLPKNLLPLERSRSAPLEYLMRDLNEIFQGGAKG